jgi:hypothetical protein
MENHYDYFFDFKEELTINMNLLLGYDIENNNFSRGCFTKTKTAIQDKLRPLKTTEIKRIGKTISWEILREIINYDFAEKKLTKTPIDEKVEKTLSKICIYLGYKNWLHFIQEVKEERKVDEASKVSQIKNDFLKAKQTEITLLGSMPVPDMELLEKIAVPKSIYYSQLETVVNNENLRFPSRWLTYKPQKIKVVEHLRQTALILVKEDIHEPFSIKDGNEQNIRLSIPTAYVIYEIYLHQSQWKILTRYETSMHVSWLVDMV